MRFEFIADEHVKVKTFLKRHEVSKSLLAKIKFSGGNILVNHQPQNAVYLLDIGDKVTIDIPSEKGFEGLDEHELKPILVEMFDKADPYWAKKPDIKWNFTKFVVDREGKVGDIGGIDKKVVSAAKKGATVFFAPNNPVTEEAKKANPNAKSNYDTAVEAAEMIKTDMKIVPVKTLQDAIDYLKNNP